ncbi:MAG: N-acetylmuramoyl-L-alanine amidase-like domain-containing protein [Planctomycetota bacterium]
MPTTIINTSAVRTRLTLVLLCILPAFHSLAFAKELTEKQAAAAKQVGVPAGEIAPLVAKPLYEFTEAEVDIYLQYLQALEPDLRRRIVHLARKNLGQPYDLYLLGEMPFEHYDPQPIYCLGKSDCLVYSEHTYAMALADDWPSFMSLLQRIRYRDGQIGVATRNHYTEADWNPSNRWLVEDITTKLADDRAMTFRQRIDRSKFLKNRYQLNVEIPIEQHEDVYLPYEAIELAKPHLAEGDFVNIVRGRPDPDAEKNSIFGGSAWIGHVGLIVHGTDKQGGKQINIIHSAKPQVREEPLDTFISESTKDLAARDAAGKARLLGFKFLRLQSNPLDRLRRLDGPDAPRVTLPKGGRAVFR